MKWAVKLIKEMMDKFLVRKSLDYCFYYEISIIIRF